VFVSSTWTALSFSKQHKILITFTDDGDSVNASFDNFVAPYCINAVQNAAVCFRRQTQCGLCVWHMNDVCKNSNSIPD